MTVRRALYRRLAGSVMRQKMRASSDRFPLGLPGLTFEPSAKGQPRVRAWFHAASAGELESLWPVIVGFASKEGSELLISVFSDSAWPVLQSLVRELAGKSGRLLFAGRSPWEDGWREALEAAEPHVWVGTKYEAWPELWASLGELGIPMVLLGASDRPSLRVATRMSRILGNRIPSLTLLAASEGDARSLSRRFPKARVETIGEPRWERVFERANKGSRRAQEIVAAAKPLPRPWGILAQAWPEDLAVWLPALIAQRRGTLWVVPHRIDLAHTAPIESSLRSAGFSPVRTSAGAGAMGAGSCVLVDEIGVLAELYPHCDWAYVGGGFGAGVHSTIEPAIAGIPVAIGPAGNARFPEIGELRSSGQLTIVESGQAARTWLADRSGVIEEARERWIREARERAGASVRALEWVEKVALAR